MGTYWTTMDDNNLVKKSAKRLKLPVASMKLNGKFANKGPKI